MDSTRIVRMIGLILLSSPAMTGTVFGQEAILPHGDPRLRADAQESQRREEIRDKRLKQQGQGPNYRIEGEPRPSPGPPSSVESHGLTRQDTGMEDPSVNPGQSSGMRSVRGRIIKSEADTYIVRQASGDDTTMVVDARTAGDRDLHPGDVITGIITPQGRAVTIEKAAP
ncbi:MAG: hypothetical protein ICV75_00895 [Nitrospiraceae bacterium]|nr:hypothetical protein [Nitrospiraceae bacterium]